MSTNTLKNTSWIVEFDSNGSRGILTLPNDTKGTYQVMGISRPCTWGEVWNNGTCALWVVFNQEIDNNVINIWGIQMTMAGGSGTTALVHQVPPAM